MRMRPADEPENSQPDIPASSSMHWIIDAHQDLAYNALTHGRDYLRSAAEIRRAEADAETPVRAEPTVLGWPEYQSGRVAVIFATLYISPSRYKGASWEIIHFASSGEARKVYQSQVDYYNRLCEDHANQFRPVKNQRDLAETLAPWQNDGRRVVPGSEDQGIAHPVGLVLLMEGAEGLSAPEELVYWWEQGLRIVGPVWAGTRYCGGMHEKGGFRPEGYELLERMAELGLTLDLAHMTEESALTALDVYEGPIICSHANAAGLLRGEKQERHLSDRAIRRLVERGGVMGVVGYNAFIAPDWVKGDRKELVSLHHLADHIDHICQLAGSSAHAGLGTDFDGGFGWPSTPAEIDTIADLQKLAPILAGRGYADHDIAAILGENWKRHLEHNLPE